MRSRPISVSPTPTKALFSGFPPWPCTWCSLPFTLIVFPLFVFLVEAPMEAIRSVASQRRWVEALCEGPPRTQMTWETSAELADAVVDQVARQLELGYSRIEPHRARFLGFDP